MLPVIALVGRPNVGKSTLYNQITRTRDAIVANYSGLTRDRKYGEAIFVDKKFIVIDTGGLGEEAQDIDVAMAQQSLTAIDDADLVIHLVDARQGLTAGDIEVSDYLRKHHKMTLVAVNKTDGLDPETACNDFYQLGVSVLCPIAATHGRGISALMRAAFSIIQTEPIVKNESLDSAGEIVSDVTGNVEVDTGAAIRIAIVGRPNVGKSTLVNRMLGEDRLVVFDMPGTTRDSVYVKLEREGRHYVLIDTAGIRKRKNVTLSIEKFSIVKTLQSIEDAHVVLLMLDASEGVVEQDLHLIGHVVEKGRAIVILLNKWDGLASDQRDNVRRELDRRMHFIDFAEMHFISALHGTGVGQLYEAIHRAYESATQKMSTASLTRILEESVSTHLPPLVNGRRIKLRYAHAGGHNPPLVIIHGNQVDRVPDHYKKYLEKSFRKALKLSGTPLRIEFVSGENPYEGRKNVLSPRQIQKRKRLVRHIKDRR